MPNQLPALHTLWIGPRIAWLERLCLTSWLMHGHEAVLWTYQTVEGIPAGIDIRDARELLPESAIVAHRFSGSVALFSNRFRYHLLRRHPVTWLDADVFLLQPLAALSPYLFAWETPDSIGSAVLRLPGNSPALRDLVGLTDARVAVPHWWPLKDRIRQRLRGIVGQHIAAEDMQWGTFGPRALTEILRRRQLINHARRSDLFYPILWAETDLFYEPEDVVDARLTGQTLAVHLWSSGSLLATPAIRQKRDAGPPRGSWIGRKCLQLGIDSGCESVGD